MKKIIPVILLLIAMMVALTSCDIGAILELIGGHTHSYGEWEVETDATCTTPGLKTRDCSCGDIQEKVIEPIGHTYGEWKIITTAECEKEGLEKRYCQCGESEQRTIAPTGHTIVIDSAVDATCSKTGLTEGKHCSVCSKTIIEQTTIPTKEHTYDDNQDTTCNDCTYVRNLCKHSNVETLSGYKATCNAPGLTDGKKCTLCNEIIESQQPIDALGHSLILVAATEPTVEDPGNREYYACSTCGKYYTNAEGTIEILPEDIKWKTYTITFFDYERDSYFMNRYKYGQTISLKSIVPEDIPGYTFVSWHTSWPCTESNAMVLVTPSNTDDLILYSNWKETVYTITYKNAAENHNPTEYTISSNITLSKPSWPGLIFSHWSDKYGNIVTSIEKGTIGDITLEANWKYAKNLAISNPDKYTYVGGMMDSNCNYYFIYDIGTIENIILSTKYTLRYDGSNVINRTETVTYKVQTSEAQTVSQAIANSVIQTNTFSTITEWMEANSKTTSQEFNLCPEVEVKGVKVKAFEYKNGVSNVEEDTYSETKSLVNTSGTESSISYEMNSYISYVYEEETSSQVSINLSPSTSPSGTYSYVRAADVRVYAIVVYDANSDQYFLEIYTMVEDVYDRTLFELASGEQYDVNIEKCDQLSFDLPMSVIPESFYTVKYDANGGKGTMLKSVHEVGVASSILSNEFTRDGYIFSGWKTSKYSSAAIYQNSATILDAVKAGETLTLYAHWTPITYTVKYDGNGGSGTMHDSTFVYDKDGQVFTKNAFSRTGYTFLGWSTNSSAKTADYSDKSKVTNLTTTPSGTVTLYAVWKANPYTVTLDANGGSVSPSTITVTYNEKYSNLPTPTRENYVFLGWKLGDTTITSSTPVTTTSNHTLVAQWLKVKNSYFGQLDEHAKVTWIYQYNFTLNGFWLDRDALINNGYKTVTVTITVTASGKTGTIGNDDPYVNICSLDGKQLNSKSINTFDDDDWETRTFSLTINLSDISADGLFIVEFHNSGSSPYFIKDCKITTEAKK